MSDAKKYKKEKKKKRKINNKGKQEEDNKKNIKKNIADPSCLPGPRIRRVFLDHVFVSSLTSGGPPRLEEDI